MALLCQVYDQYAGETGGSLAQIAAVTEIVERDLRSSTLVEEREGSRFRWHSAGAG
ncbi:methyltransferase type 11 [Cutibacterium acnes JCM 18909]|nr:methyltransferase type 11 [Cutibacterium acnes JCM 18909]